jgi:hypothetical protein
MGARCSPSRRARSQSASCTQPGPISCNTSTQLPACVSFCAPMPPVAATEGATCAMNPCDADAFSVSGAVLCPDNWSCVPYSARFGNCRRLDTQIAGLCSSVGTNPCPTGTYCRPFNASFPRPTGTRYADTRRDGMCVEPIREGGLCETSFGAVGTSTGRQCEAGMICDFMPGTSSGAKRCQRPCPGGVTECPCNTGTTTISCLGEGTAQPVCNFCFADQTSCTPGVAACCNPNATCQGQAGNTECCVSNGATCSTNNECCNGVCLGNNTCGACVGPGGAGTQSQCCGGLTSVGGVCSVPCIDPVTRSTAVVGSACARSSPGCISTTQCDPVNGFWCRDAQGTSSTDMTCNGIDDDCRNGVDDQAWMTCNWTPPGCQSGFVLPGTRRCTPGSTCMPVGRSDAFCKLDASGNPSGPSGCWTGSGPDCSIDGCDTNEVCGPESGYTCTSGVPGTACSARGGPLGGCGETVTGCGFQCRVNPNAVGTCWLP